jgi:hypothetical protein
MMHRTNSGKLVEINKMDFKNDQSCFNKIYSLKQTDLSSLLNSPFGPSSFIKQIVPKSVPQQFTFAHNN